MSATHTPGPWRFARNEASTGPLMGAFVLSGSTQLAMVQSRTIGSQVECEANARLIAAAPDLLAALTLLEAEMVASGNAGSTDYGWKPAIEKTRAAISKATGDAA